MERLYGPVESGQAPKVTHTLMITQHGESGFKWLHVLGEQLNASGWAEESRYLSILLITLWESTYQLRTVPLTRVNFVTTVLYIDFAYTHTHAHAHAHTHTNWKPFGLRTVSLPLSHCCCI